jgi:3-methyladenine DNA glycosylase AlkC
MIWPVTEAVVARALQDRQPDSFDAALALLADLTPRLTAEFAIRSLLQADLDRALPVILSWTEHPDEHVRRLASEGTRPFLPWSKRVRTILSRPEVTRPILDALYRDDSEFVRRSVANHLNDLGRQQPELAVAIATGWTADPDDNTAWVVRHGLRTLVKKANPDALALLGFTPALHVTVRGPVLGNTTVQVGDYLPFEVTLVNTGPEPAPVAVDYIVHHLKANGTQTPKVFKLTTKTLRPGETLTLSRRHSFKHISTRVYREGRHAIEVQVNGTTWGRTVFDLVADPG